MPGSWRIELTMTEGNMRNNVNGLGDGSNVRGYSPTSLHQGPYPFDSIRSAGVLKRVLAGCLAVAVGAVPGIAAERKAPRKESPKKVERIDCMVGTDNRQA